MKDIGYELGGYKDAEGGNYFNDHEYDLTHWE